MGSALTKIEIYGKNSFACPEFDLWGYNDIDELMEEVYVRLYRAGYHDIYDSP